MSKSSAHMNAVDLRFTVERIAKLKARIDEAKRLDQPHNDDLLELYGLNMRLWEHPIRANVDFENKSPLELVTYDQTLHDRSRDYWYGVRYEARPLKAFVRSSGLLLWLSERNLSLTTPLPQVGVYSTQFLLGSYREASHCSYDVFYSLIGTRIRTMSNGAPTMGIITDDEDGLKTVHTLNPNCADRPVYGHAEYWIMYG